MFDAAMQNGGQITRAQARKAIDRDDRLNPTISMIITEGVMYRVSRRVFRITEELLMTEAQRTILSIARSQGGNITKAQAVAALGGNYYSGADNHVGAILSRMVNAGLLERITPGVFRVPASPPASPLDGLFAG